MNLSFSSTLILEPLSQEFTPVFASEVLAHARQGTLQNPFRAHPNFSKEDNDNFDNNPSDNHHLSTQWPPVQLSPSCPPMALPAVRLTHFQRYELPTNCWPETLKGRRYWHRSLRMGRKTGNRSRRDIRIQGMYADGGINRFSLHQSVRISSRAFTPVSQRTSVNHMP